MFVVWYMANNTRFLTPWKIILPVHQSQYVHIFKSSNDTMMREYYVSRSSLAPSIPPRNTCNQFDLDNTHITVFFQVVFNTRYDLREPHDDMRRRHYRSRSRPTPFNETTSDKKRYAVRRVHEMELSVCESYIYMYTDPEDPLLRKLNS